MGVGESDWGCLSHSSSAFQMSAGNMEQLGVWDQKAELSHAGMRAELSHTGMSSSGCLVLSSEE